MRTELAAKWSNLIRDSLSSTLRIGKLNFSLGENEEEQDNDDDDEDEMICSNQPHCLS